MHSTFNPSSMPQQHLEATLIERGGTVKRIVELLTDDSRHSSKHNILLVGPRGIGKSHTIAVIYHRLVAQKLEKRVGIAYLREDEWGLTSLSDLLLRIYEALGGNRSDESTGLQINPLDKTSSDVEANIWKLILTKLGRRSLLVIIENLDTVLANIGFDGQQRLRGLVQTFPIWSFLATSTTLSKDLSDQRSPFYGFFDLFRLEQLSITNAVALMRRIAAFRGDTKMDSFIASPIGRARMRAVQHLAGGNARIFVIFYDILQRRESNELIDANVLEPLQRMIDFLTPYYQSEMRSLPPLQQKIILYLCQRRVPMTVTSISKGTFSSNQTIASQLRQLLDNRIVRVNRLGRESYYELAEPLMRICLEAKSHDGGPLRLLVEFLRYWFYREELEKQLSSLEESREAHQYLSAALKQYDSGEGHHHLTPEIGELCEALSLAQSSDEMGIAEELATVSKIAEDWGHYVRAKLISNRIAEAIPDVERAVRHHPEDIDSLLALGRAYTATGRYEEALRLYKRAIELKPKNAMSWYEQGKTLSRLHRSDDAIISLDSARKLDPRMDSEIRVAKADTMVRTERYEEALKTLRPALKNGKEEYGIFGVFGWALYKLQRYREASEYLQKATEYFPHDQMARTYLGLCFQKSGDSAKALTILEQAYRLKPETKWTASHYCGALLADEKYDKALIEIPNEIVGHRIFHLFIDLLNQHLKQGALQNEIAAIEQMSADPRWGQAFRGALAELLGLASKEENTAERIRDIEVWHMASRELYESQPEYSIYLAVLDALVQYKKGAGLSTLLGLPLEQRRLIISEVDEQSLGRR